MSVLESVSMLKADNDCIIISGKNDALDGGAVVNALVDIGGGVEDNDGICNEAADDSNDENDFEHYNTASASSIGIAFGSPSASAFDSTSALTQDDSSLVPISPQRLHEAHTSSSSLLAVSAVSQHLDEDMKEKIDYMLEYSFSRALRSNLMWVNLIYYSFNYIVDYFQKKPNIMNQKNLMRSIVKYLSPILRQHLCLLNRKREEILSIEATIVLAFMKTEYCRNLSVDMDRFLENYPQFLSPAVNDVERAKLHEFCNCVMVIQILIPAKNNKEHLLDLVSRMTEGFYVRRITGTGMTVETRNRYDIIHQEAGLTPQNRLDKRKREETNEFPALEVANQGSNDSKRASNCLDNDDYTNSNNSDIRSSSRNNSNNGGGGDQISNLDSCLNSNSNSNSSNSKQRSTNSNNFDSESPLSLNRQNIFFTADSQGFYRGQPNSGSVSPKTPLISPSGSMVKSNRGRPRSLRFEGEDRIITSSPSLLHIPRSQPPLRLQEEEIAMMSIYQNQLQQQQQLAPLGISQTLSLAASGGLRGASSYLHNSSNNCNVNNDSSLLPFNLPTHVSSSMMMPINLSSHPTSSYGNLSSGLPGMNYTLASMNMSADNNSNNSNSNSNNSSSNSNNSSNFSSNYNLLSSNSQLNHMQSIDARNKLLILLQAGIGPN